MEAELAGNARPGLQMIIFQAGHLLRPFRVFMTGKWGLPLPKPYYCPIAARTLVFLVARMQ
jgi:hypothetical protein